MTGINRDAWVTWQIRAIWRAVLELTSRVEALERDNPNDAREG